jgi:hypothetical protein
VHAACLSAGCLFFWLLALAGSCVIYSYGFRTRLREKYGLPPKPCGDFCTDYWCICCSLAQETRELQNRGIDPALGNSTKTKPPPAAFQLQSNSQLCPQKPNLLLNPTARDHTNILKLKLLNHYKQKKKPFQLGETTRFLQLSK